LDADIKESNGNNVAVAFSAYLVAGSKEHFYNIITENNLKNFNEKGQVMENMKNLA